jgi:hypothetical protein
LVETAGFGCLFGYGRWSPSGLATASPTLMPLAALPLAPWPGLINRRALPRVNPAAVPPPLRCPAGRTSPARGHACPRCTYPDGWMVEPAGFGCLLDYGKSGSSDLATTGPTLTAFTVLPPTPLAGVNRCALQRGPCSSDSTLVLPCWPYEPCPKSPARGRACPRCTYPGARACQSAARGSAARGARPVAAPCCCRRRTAPRTPPPTGWSSRQGPHRTTA